MSIFAKAQNSWIVDAIRKMFKVTVINPENEPKGTEIGAFIVCANHSSNWDPIIIGACMNRPLRYMAKSELFKIPVLKNIITWFGAYPVNRERADVSSIKTTINILEQGESVGMYIQGGRKRGKHPKDTTPKNGAAMIAVKAKCGVLPVSIVSKHHKVRAFRRTIFVFGEYMPYDELVKGCGDTPDTSSGGDGPAKISENMALYKEVTNKIYAEVVANYDRHGILNSIKNNLQI